MQTTAARASHRPSPPRAHRGVILRRRRGHLRLWVLLSFVHPRLRSSNPAVELLGQRVDGAALVVHMPMDRHALPLLPALDGRDVTIQIGRDFLPRVQPLTRRLLRDRDFVRRLVHGSLLRKSHLVAAVRCILALEIKAAIDGI